MRPLALVLLASLAACSGERSSAAQYSDDGFVSDFSDPGENEVAGEKVESLVGESERPLHRLVSRVEVLPDRVLLYSDDGDATVAEVHGAGVITQSVLVRRSSLEDVFLRLTGRSLVE